MVGGGSVTTVGGCTVSLFFRDQESNEWRELGVTFVVIRGPRTIILGTPFMTDHYAVPFMDEQYIMVRPAGSEGTFTVACVPVVKEGGRTPLLAHLEGEVQPLVYTSETVSLKGWGETGVCVRVPEYIKEGVYITTLDPTDKSTYLNMMGLRVQEGFHAVGDGGYVKLKILNPTTRTIRLEASTPVGLFALKPETKLVPDMDIEEIVDNLDICGVEGELLEQRKADVKKMLMQQRELRQM